MNMTDMKLKKVESQLLDIVTQLKHTLFNGEIKPYYLEALAGFMWVGNQVPSNLAPYTGGNYYMNITGSQGANFVTVTGGGNIADAGTTTKWASVIKDDSGSWTPYLVTGTDGVNKVYIYPNLANTITAGEIGNLNDAALGQHYTERGYFALAQYIYKSLPIYAERNTYIAKFRGSDLTSGWTKIGNPFLEYNSSANPYQSAFGAFKVYSNKNIKAYCYANGTTQGIEWSVSNLSGKRGFLETFVGTIEDVTTVVVEYYLDNVLIKTVNGIGREVKKLLFPFSNASSSKIRVYIPNCSVVTNIHVSDTTWWINEKDNFAKMLNPYSKVVYLGDSWGEYHNKAISRELSRLLSIDSGTTINVINPSVGGMTSAWGRAWFDEYVIKQKPTHVIIEFFTNDRNSAEGSVYGNFTAPDGKSYPLTVTKEQWRDNIRYMVDAAISHLIQPIVLCPCGQSTELAKWNVYLTEGVVSQ